MRRSRKPKIKIDRREQFKSLLVRKGEGDAHAKGVSRVIEALIKEEWAITPKYPILVNGYVGSILPNFEIEYYHEYDVFAQKVHNNKLISRIIVEVDGKAHEGDNQKVRDHTAQEYAEFFINDIVFIRISLSIALDASLEDLYKEIMQE